MFLTKQKLLLMQENISLKGEVAAMGTRLTQQEKQLEFFYNALAKKEEQERRMAAQFDNLFAYGGRQRPEVKDEN